MTESGGELTELFRIAFRNHAARVAIITAEDGDGPLGLTATSVISVSADPALLAFSLSGRSRTAARIARVDTVVVHLLSAGQVELAKRFSVSGVDRFAAPASWRRLATGEPLLLGVDSWLRGRIVRRCAVADATLSVVDVLQAEPGSLSDPPLVYRDRSWYALDETAEVA
ncbi:flavin reductase family protein [Nocardiopsis nanhaiensis]